MKTLLCILLAFLCPFIVAAVIGLSKTFYRYHNDPVYREKMNKRAKALERKRKATKKRKLVRSSSSDVITDILG